jgi:hypothetical protein
MSIDAPRIAMQRPISPIRGVSSMGFLFHGSLALLVLLFLAAFVVLWVVLVHVIDAWTLLGIPLALLLIFVTTMRELA